MDSVCPQRRAAAAVAAAAALLVSGCTNTPAPSTRPAEVAFTEVDTAAWNDDTSRVSDFTALPAQGGAPRLTVATVGASGHARQVTVWAASLGAASGQPTTVPGIPGDVVGVATAGVGTLTAIAGTTWKDGRYSSYLVTSPDRRAWTPVALPDDVSASRVTRVAVPDDHTVVVAGDGTLGRAQRVSLLDTRSGRWTTTALPVPDEASGQTITGLGVSPEQRIVLTMSAGPGGKLWSPVSFVSRDKGTTFDGPVQIADSGSTVAGVVWAATGFVATGGRRGGDGNRRPMAWTSADGSSWTAEVKSRVVVCDGCRVFFDGS